jgi:hypothetical protein
MKVVDLFDYFNVVDFGKPQEHDGLVHYKIKRNLELYIDGDLYTHYYIQDDVVTFFGGEFNFDIGIKDSFKNDVIVKKIGLGYKNVM